MPNDKDREEVRKFIRQLEDESNVFAREIFVTDAFARIRAEAKAEALRDAAEGARGQKWPNDGTGRYDMFNRGVEAAYSTILAAEPQAECTWAFDASTDSWDSSCGEKWSFTADGPSENGVRSEPREFEIEEDGE